MAIFDWLKFGKAASGPVRAPKALPEQGVPVTANPDTILKAAREKMAPLATVCYVPRVMEGRGTEKSSHFCGDAALREGEPWPTCGGCKAPMQLFVQLSSATFPSGVDPFGPGLLQLFYCTNDKCEPGMDDWSGFAQNQLARLLPAGTPLKLASAPANCTFPSRVITGWETEPDYPNWEEAEMMGIKLDKAASRAFYGEQEETPVQGEKLLGWPYWVQGVEYVDCPECGERMTYLFQVDSEKNIPYMFGDVGAGHISVCRKHPNRCSFRWSCC